jgi:hypothetical protein
MLYTFHVTLKCAFQVRIEMNKMTAASLRLSLVSRLPDEQRCKIMVCRKEQVLRIRSFGDYMVKVMWKAIRKYWC